MSGVVLNPVAANLADGVQQASNVFGRQGEQLKGDLHGKWFVANARKSVFVFTKSGFTQVATGSGPVSLFTLYNPPSSGVMAEIISTEVNAVSATTVVNVLGWYFSTAALTALGTFTTPAVAGTNYFSGRAGDTPNGGVVPYISFTHSGTPVRLDVVASFAAITNTSIQSAVKWHEGTLLLPPGIAMSLLASTASFTNADLAVKWAEYPFA